MKIVGTQYLYMRIRAEKLIKVDFSIMQLKKIGVRESLNELIFIYSKNKIIFTIARNSHGLDICE